jgi:hypothetical protein
MAGKTWVLETGTKGTGANLVPIEKALKKPERPAESPARPPEPRRPSAPSSEGRERRRQRPHQVERTTTPLPSGHVRKRSTGEIGKVQAVDAQAGTATVRWLKQGSVSTVPLSAVSRR